MTRDERREVARRLRDFKQLRAAFKDSSICAFSDALGVGYMDWEHICARLADLIEPEERTCRMIDNGVELCCSECDGRHSYDDEPDYCMRCGARVVDADA